MRDLAFCFAFFVTLMLAGAATAQPLSLVKIADTETPIPEGQGTFESLGRPAIRGSVIAFVGHGPGGQRGVYQSVNGQLTRIVDRSSPGPEGPGTFANALFPDVSVGQDGVAFSMEGPGAYSAIYTHSQGTLVRIADSSTPVPGPSAIVGHLSAPWMEGGQVAFAGGTGIYVGSGGSIQLVVDLNMPVPGGNGNFTSLGPPFLHQGTISFYGAENGRSGFYSSRLGVAPTVLVDTSTPVPGGLGSFDPFSPSDFAAEGLEVAFVGRVNGDSALYRIHDGTIELVADKTTAVPTDNSTFQSFWGVFSVSDGGAAFMGSGFNGTEGIYATSGDNLVKAFDSHDAPMVNQLAPGRQALSGSQVAFWTVLGGSSVLYVATLPPVTLCSTELVKSADGLDLRYELATPEPVVWSVWLSYREHMIPLWSIPLPAIERPYENEVGLPGLVAVGAIGFVSSFTTEAGGVTCSDWDRFDTGAPGATP